MLKNGWTMQGDKNSIAITKGNCKTVFYIKIYTTKEVILAI